MIVLDDIQRGWRFVDQYADTDGVPAQILDGVEALYGQPLLAAHEQQRHLLIPIAAQWQTRGDQSSAGIHLLINEWGIDGTVQLYADVVCLKPHLNDLFDLVIFDICTALAESKIHPVDVCRRVLEQWRELLDKDSVGLPDMQTIVGLFGELWILRVLTQRHQRAVELWNGPMGARHDFSNGRTALEVKTTQQRFGRLITIHGHDQLEPPAGGTLHVAFLQLEEVSSGGESIADLVQALVTLGSNSYQLMRRLAHLGIGEAMLMQMRTTQFLIRCWDTYYVDDSFPCIVSQSFVVGSVPQRVLSLTYKIDLSASPPSPLSTEDAAALSQQITGIFSNETEA